MEDQNVVIFLDKIKKILELGNKPKAIVELDAVIHVLEKKIRKSKGNRFHLLHIVKHIPGEPTNPEYQEITKQSQKINEILCFLNERFPLL